MIFSLSLTQAFHKKKITKNSNFSSMVGHSFQNYDKLYAGLSVAHTCLQVQVHLFTLFNYNTTTIKDKKEVKNRADDTLS